MKGERRYRKTQDHGAARDKYMTLCNKRESHMALILSSGECSLYRWVFFLASTESYISEIKEKHIDYIDKMYIFVIVHTVFFYWMYGGHHLSTNSSYTGLRHGSAFLHGCEEYDFQYSNRQLRVPVVFHLRKTGKIKHVMLLELMLPKSEEHFVR